MHKPSKPDVLRIAGEPVAFIWETAAETGVQLARPHPNLGVAVVPLYTESQLLAMYAKGAEDMRERAARICETYTDPTRPASCSGYAFWHAKPIRALPITPTNTEGEQDERKDYCGSCGEWTGGPLICCHESQSAGHKPNVTKTEAITVRQTRKESRDEARERRFRLLVERTRT